MTNTYKAAMIGGAALMALGTGAAYAPAHADGIPRHTLEGSLKDTQRGQQYASKDCGWLQVGMVGSPNRWMHYAIPVAGKTKANLDNLLGRTGEWSSGNHFEAIVDGLQDKQYSPLKNMARNNPYVAAFYKAGEDQEFSFAKMKGRENVRNAMAIIDYGNSGMRISEVKYTTHACISQRELGPASKEMVRISGHNMNAAKPEAAFSPFGSTEFAVYVPANWVAAVHKAAPADRPGQLADLFEAAHLNGDSVQKQVIPQQIGGSFLRASPQNVFPAEFARRQTNVWGALGRALNGGPYYIVPTDFRIQYSAAPVKSKARRN